MSEKYEKKQIYEFCEIRNTMVRLDVIQATVRMPDLVHAEVRLVPVDCNNAKVCQGRGISCMVYVEGGNDPCPGVWKGEA